MNPNESGMGDDFEMEDGGADPFGEFEEDAGDSGTSAAGSDPFDFSEGPSVSPPGAMPSQKVNPRAELAAKANPIASTGMKSQTAALANDLPVQLVAVMGKKNITVGELLALKKGEIIELNRFPNEAIDLVANGRLMAKGELVEIDGKLGIRIIKIYS